MVSAETKHAMETATPETPTMMQAANILPDSPVAVAQAATDATSRRCQFDSGTQEVAPPTPFAAG
jgi:hypothetical protein